MPLATCQHLLSKVDVRFKAIDLQILEGNSNSLRLVVELGMHVLSYQWKTGHMGKVELTVIRTPCVFEFIYSGSKEFLR